MKSLPTRLLSACIAILILFLLYKWGPYGFQTVCFAAVVLGTRELIRILFKPDDSLLFKFLFYLFMVFLFAASVVNINMSSIYFALISIVFFSTSLLRRKRFDDLRSLFEFQAKGILGFMYLGLFPAFACNILTIENGVVWFVALLSVVFAGDTLAYFIGILFGKKKVLEEISPKKTYAGAVGGLFGSALAGFIFSIWFLPHIPAVWLISLGLVAGFFGQMGDFFESLIKRVADKKDSGSLMPGHGGVLDRIDGILFAAPWFYLISSLLEKHF